MSRTKRIPPTSALPSRPYEVGDLLLAPLRDKWVIGVVISTSPCTMSFGDFTMRVLPFTGYVVLKSETHREAGVHIGEAFDSPEAAADVLSKYRGTPRRHVTARSA